MTRTEWILGGLLVVLLVVVAGMALLLWFQPEINNPPAVTIQPVAQQPSANTATALIASTFAQQVAQSWQGDAKLFQATATWQQVSLQQMQMGSGPWSFTYYSPGQTAVAVINVIDNQASLIQENGSENRLAPLEVSGWRINSPEAVDIMLQQGGEAFMGQEGAATLIMTLTTDNGNGRMEWFVSLFAEQSGKSFTTRLDATSGEVLEVIQAP